MIPLEDFRSENREIKDLCNLLGTTLEHDNLRDNSIVCELLGRFVERVQSHLVHEDRSVYRDLLKQHTNEADLLADHYLGNTQELKRLFNSYTRDWCRKSHTVNIHQKFIDESREMFRLVCDRIKFEEEKIFPFFETT